MAGRRVKGTPAGDDHEACRYLLAEDGRDRKAGLGVGAQRDDPVAVGVPGCGDGYRRPRPYVLQAQQRAGTADSTVDVADENDRPSRFAGEAAAGPPSDVGRVGRYGQRAAGLDAGRQHRCVDPDGGNQQPDGNLDGRHGRRTGWRLCRPAAMGRSRTVRRSAVTARHRVW